MDTGLVCILITAACVLVAGGFSWAQAYRRWRDCLEHGHQWEYYTSHFSTGVDAHLWCRHCRHNPYN
jgi:hypothetical protein